MGRSMNPRKCDPALVDGDHVGAEEAPGDREQDDHDDDGPEEGHASEPQNHSALNKATPR